MRTHAAVAVIGIWVPVLVACAGCGPDQNERLVRATQKCEEHCRELERELQGERATAGSRNGQLDALRVQVAARDAEISQLESENRRLADRIRSLEAIVGRKRDRTTR
jgi:hypothetical protein